MTYKQAIKILINSASSDLRGQGLGYKSDKSEAERKDIEQAIEKLWPKVYPWKMSENDKYNLF